MANHKSAKKRIRQNARRKTINRISIQKMKTLTKSVFASEDKENIEEKFKAAVAHIDRISTKGRIHKNTAARKKRALAVHVNSLLAAEK